MSEFDAVLIAKNARNATMLDLTGLTYQIATPFRTVQFETPED